MAAPGAGVNTRLLLYCTSKLRPTRPKCILIASYSHVHVRIYICVFAIYNSTTSVKTAEHQQDVKVRQALKKLELEMTNDRRIV